MRRGFTSVRPDRLLLGTACALVLGAAAVTIDSRQASAQFLPSYFPAYAPPYVSRHAPRPLPKPKHKVAHKPAEHASKLPFGDIPKGPLEIFVSTSQQRLHFYSDGVHVADAPVATGVPDHPTPLGVFSVIQRDRYHRSNIYSDAPMPYMERITWSGVALHEGVGLGHPASHGCIRMPHDFAARLWMLRTMGMRVIIARPELRPLPFADPHLFVHKEEPVNPAPAPTAALATAQQSKPASRTDAIGGPLAGAIPGVAAPTSGQANAAPASPAAANADPPDPAKVQGSTNPAAPAPVAPTAISPANSATATDAAGKPAAPAANGAATASQPAPASASPNQTTGPQSPAGASSAGASSAPAAPAVAAASDIDDDTPLPPLRPEQMAGGKGPIAIFISRKTSKIYVRQDFTPVFDAPVKIENPGESIGTHVFTAMDYLPDHSAFNWTVVSLPAAPPKEVEGWKYVKGAHGRMRRVRVRERAEPVTPVETPQEALGRIEIPQDAIDQISRLIVPGSSLIVSDQGLGPETGEGTDFIVVSR